MFTSFEASRPLRPEALKLPNTQSHPLPGNPQIRTPRPSSLMHKDGQGTSSYLSRSASKADVASLRNQLLRVVRRKAPRLLVNSHREVHTRVVFVKVWWLFLPAAQRSGARLKLAHAMTRSRKRSAGV